MIKEIKMYIVICDSCGKDSCKDSQFAAWTEKRNATDTAFDLKWGEKEGKHYCTDCYEYDNSGNLINIKQI